MKYDTGHMIPCTRSARSFLDYSGVLPASDPEILFVYKPTSVEMRLSRTSLP